ncbi:hypothetical protein NC652_018428 [Populus alba x Populus x berolinensis]|nr:hypothetical protein NC652_018428 [Populus alba x Populus x berolinensis]
MGLGRVSRKMRMRFTKYSFAQSPLCLSQREQRLWGFSGPLARHLQGTELRARASISELSAWPASHYKTSQATLENSMGLLGTSINEPCIDMGFNPCVGLRENVT